MNSEITVNGKKPVNRLGSCFDSAGAVILKIKEPQAIMCHGLGIANLPGQEGEIIAHAWVEFTDQKEGRIAVDPIWMIAQPVDLYRKNLKTFLVIEYKRKVFLKLWKERGYPGPYDRRIKEFTLEGKRKKING